MAHDEVTLAAKLVADVAHAEADAQAEAALTQAAAEEKAAAATAKVLQAQTVKAFNDTFTAVKAQDSEAEWLEGPFNDTKHELANLKLCFLICAKVQCNVQCLQWKMKTASDTSDLLRSIQMHKELDHLHVEISTTNHQVEVRHNTHFSKSYYQQLIPPSEYSIIEGYYQEHCAEVRDLTFDFHVRFKPKFHAKHRELIPDEAQAEAGA